MSASTTYQAIYSFGDSLSDAGDAFLITNSSYASILGQSPEPVSPPYFRESYGTTTANVFSNGPLWVQDLAAAYGLPNPAPGSIGLDANTLTALLTPQVGAVAASATVQGLEARLNAVGVNPYLQLVSGATGGTDFAIGGSVTGVTGENSGAAVALSDLPAQIANFQAAVRNPLASALYTVWSGSNDLLNLLEDPNFAALDAAGTAAADVAQSVANEVAAVQTLIAGGAQNLLVLDVPDLGKTPAIAKGAYSANTSAASSLSTSFDQALASALQGLDTGTAHVSLEDTYSLIDNAVQNPASYGLTDVSDPAYTGSFTSDSGTLVSTNANVQDQYLFFDRQHPTETGQSAIAQLAQNVLSAGISGSEAAALAMLQAAAPGVDGVIHSDVSSLQFAMLEAQGLSLTFIPNAESVALVDGTLSVGPDTQEATIQRLYEGLLGRGGDVSGLSSFDADLSAGASRPAVAAGFLGSSEYQALHGTQSDGQFVSSLYQGFLGRQPDASGGAYYTGLLASGMSRADVTVGIADSQEAKARLAPTTTHLWVPSADGTLAYEAYQTGLDREIELPSLSNIVTALTNGLTPLKIFQDIAGSAEFQGLHGAQDNATFVGSLYQDGLGRAPDPSGGAYYTGLLNGGATRASVLQDIATSGEAAAHLTRSL
jgi:phospholipase/lecithinase/hemolysin